MPYVGPGSAAPVRPRTERCLGTLGVCLLALHLAGCATGGTFDDSCRISSECPGGRVCLDGRCVPDPLRDASSGADASIPLDGATPRDAASFDAAPDAGEGPGTEPAAEAGTPAEAGAPDASGAAACADGVRGPGEADVDCGGPCPPCADGRTCLVPEDCASGTCEAGRCRRCVTTMPTWSSAASGSCGGWGATTVRQVEVTGPTTMRIRVESWSGESPEYCDVTVTLSGATWSSAASGSCGGWGPTTVRQVEVTGPTTMRIRTESWSGESPEYCDVVVTLSGVRTCT